LAAPALSFGAREIGVAKRGSAGAEDGARALQLVGGKTPRMRKANPDGWTKAKDAEFLGALEATCNVTAAAAVAGVSVSAAYRRRKSHAAFRIGWHARLRSDIRALLPRCRPCAGRSSPRNGGGSDQRRRAAERHRRNQEPLAGAAADGGLQLGWARRSRSGWEWRDEIDVPLGETRELYRIKVEGSSARIVMESAVASLTIPASALAPIGPGAASIHVCQIGDYALSRPATADIVLP
jgi:hypothetical protein